MTSNSNSSTGPENSVAQAVSDALKEDSLKVSRRVYVLVTPVKDEESLIGQTIAAVIAQTRRPAEWVIVSDGSTDRTESIVQEAGRRHPWIRLLSLPVRTDRCFASVVRATEAGICELSVNEYDFIGFLDGDVRFELDYFERLMGKFDEHPNLGMAGGVVLDIGCVHGRVPRNRDDVPGATQFFRKACLEAIGSLVAIPEGGWDALTCVQARMAGYETRLFTDLRVDHLKPRNISQGGAIERKWQLGVRDYALGYCPLFEIFKCVSRIREPPMVAGALAWLSGFLWSALRRQPRRISKELLRFVQMEQTARLRTLLALWVVPDGTAKDA